jgi:hypothetical protein
MAEFVNDTSGVLYPWGGYQPCATVEACMLPGKGRYDVMFRCSTLATGPMPRQTYCHCDFGLVGPGCGEYTSASTYRIVILIAAATIAALAIPNGVHEIYCRSRPLKVNPVYVSLWLALTGGVFIVFWGIFGVYVILGTSSGVDVSGPRFFVANAAIPGGLVFPFAAAMVVSLAWRKVVIASDLRSSDNKQAIEKREKHYRNMVVTFCIVMFVVLGSVMAVVGVSQALLLLVLFNFAGGIFFYRSGKAFKRNMTSTFGIGTNISDKAKMTPEEQCLRAANRANHLVIVGMFLVVFGSVLTILLEKVIGVPTAVGEIEIGAFPTGLIAIGVGTSEAAMVLYSRQVRMIGVNRRKKLKAANAAKGGALFSNLNSSVAANSVTPFSAGAGGNKVAPST